MSSDVTWYWGGNFGLFLLPALVVVGAVLGWRGAEMVAWLLAALGQTPDIGLAFVTGIFAAIIPMTLGYALWWGAFWLRNR